jgi:hypothetical protein
MANQPKSNLPNISLENKSCPKGSETETHYASKKVLAKASTSTERPSQYTLESKSK